MPLILRQILRQATWPATVIAVAGVTMGLWGLGSTGVERGPSASPSPTRARASADPRPGIGSWTQYRGDFLNTGVSHSPRPDWKKVGIKWKYWTGSYQSSTPAVAEGKIIVCTEDGDTHCVDAATGKKVWKTLCTPVRATGKGIVFCSPLIYDGRIYVGNKVGQLWCLDFKTGEKKWTWQEEGSAPRIYSSPKGDERGIVFGTADVELTRGAIVCLDPKTGKLRWRVAAGREIGATPAILGNSVYVPCKDRRLYEIDFLTGKTKRKLHLPGTTLCSVAIGLGYGYLVTGGRQSVAIDLLQDKVAWTSEATSDDKTAPAYSNGRAYYSLGRYLYGFDAVRGEVLWKFETASKLAPPSVNGDEVLLSGHDGWFRVIGRDGKEVHRVYLGEPCAAGPVLVDQVVYVASDVNTGHHLFALAESP